MRNLWILETVKRDVIALANHWPERERGRGRRRKRPSTWSSRKHGAPTEADWYREAGGFAGVRGTGLWDIRMEDRSSRQLGREIWEMYTDGI